MIAIAQQGLLANKLQIWRGDNLQARPARTRVCTSLVLCLLLAHVLAPLVSAQEDGSAGEYEVKAAMLYNLMQFVEWPASSYSSPQALTVLCLLGRDPFGSSLTSVASNKVVEGRPVEIRHLQDMAAARVCQLLYVSSSERKRIVEILANLKGSSVLTVGEMTQFAARGGMIQFGLEEKRVRLEINLDAANQSGVKISSRLLAIARIVKYQDKNARWEGSPTDAQTFDSVTLPLRSSGAPRPNAIAIGISSSAVDEGHRSR